ncbi:hypothetical protein NHX12_007052, partial [Muraenolepis orangiensis]
MESLAGEDSPEDIPGKKKSKLKILKSRLFKRAKKADDGSYNLSQSTSDITAGAGLGSEEDLTCSDVKLGSRSVSHDSIFVADEVLVDPEPARVLSQENIHSKIKALQEKLQQQKLHLGPTAMGLSIKRPDHLGRPPANFSRPAQVASCLDTSAARHRMSVKPRNQRASTKGRKLTLWLSRVFQVPLSKDGDVKDKGAFVPRRETIKKGEAAQPAKQAAITTGVVAGVEVSQMGTEESVDAEEDQGEQGTAAFGVKLRSTSLSLSPSSSLSVPRRRRRNRRRGSFPVREEDRLAGWGEGCLPVFLCCTFIDTRVVCIGQKSAILAGSCQKKVNGL